MQYRQSQIRKSDFNETNKTEKDVNLRYAKFLMHMH